MIQIVQKTKQLGNDFPLQPVDYSNLLRRAQTRGLTQKGLAAVAGMAEC